MKVVLASDPGADFPRPRGDLGFDDERQQKLLQASAFVGAQQIEFNTHLIFANGTHYFSHSDDWLSTVGNIEAEANLGTGGHGL